MAETPPLTSIDGITDPTVLGRGPRATVYRAVRQSTQRPVALRVLNAPVPAASRAAFDARCAAMAEMSADPAFADIYATGWLPDGRPYLITELGSGSYGDLAAAGPARAAQILAAGAVIADGLSRAHQANVLHGQIKPSNLLRCADGARLTDFGFDLPADPTPGSPPAFAPPETIWALPRTPNGDVYGLCATLYALLLGRPPRRIGSQFPDVIRTRELFELPLPELPSIAAELVTVLQRGIGYDPGSRPSMTAVRDALVAAAPQPATTGVPELAADSDAPALAGWQPVDPAPTEPAAVFPAHSEPAQPDPAAQPGPAAQLGFDAQPGFVAQPADGTEPIGAASTSAATAMPELTETVDFAVIPPPSLPPATPLPSNPIPPTPPRPGSNRRRPAALILAGVCAILLIAGAGWYSYVQGHRSEHIATAADLAAGTQTASLPAPTTSAPADDVTPSPSPTASKKASASPSSSPRPSPTRTSASPTPSATPKVCPNNGQGDFTMLVTGILDGQQKTGTTKLHIRGAKGAGFFHAWTDNGWDGTADRDDYQTKIITLFQGVNKFVGNGGQNIPTKVGQGVKSNWRTTGSGALTGNGVLLLTRLTNDC